MNIGHPKRVIEVEPASLPLPVQEPVPVEPSPAVEPSPPQPVERPTR
jgi:hypothetical protein